MQNDAVKHEVHEFWNAASCGEVYARGEDRRAWFRAQAEARYALEPYIRAFAGFADGRDRAVLEVGVGMGADHTEWARARPSRLAGLDLTERAIELTRERLALEGLRSELATGDAENLPFPDASFDLVYSYGVLHHTPDTPRAFREVFRVLRPGGEARVMIYHRRSLVGAMLWLRYAALRGRPWTSLDAVYAQHLESPGTKAYSRAGARELCRDFREVNTWIQLGHGDLLEGAAGQRHDGALLRAARALWPRTLIGRYGTALGLGLMIHARK